MSNHKVVKTIRYKLHGQGSAYSNYTNPKRAATAITEAIARRLTEPKYETTPYDPAFGMRPWDSALYWANYERIYRRAYPRVLRACQNLLK